MKKLGIIGGAGPLASSLLYEEVVRNCYQYGGIIPEMIILNFPFSRLLSKREAGNHRERVKAELGYCITQLEEMGAEVAVLACNTMHLLLRAIPHGTIHFAGLPEMVLEEAKNHQARRLLFLGTENSCRSGLYNQSEIEMVYPSAQEQRLVDAVIDHVLVGRLLNEDSAQISQLIHAISSRESLDGVVLGCTDLPVLHHHHAIACAMPIYDSIKIPSRRIRDLL